MAFQLEISENFTLNWENFKNEGLRIAIFGQSGSGKSHAVKVFLEEFVKSKIPYVVIDPEGEYISFKEISPALIVGGKYSDIPLKEAILDDILEALFKNHINIIFDISEIIGFEMRAKIAADIQKSIFNTSSQFREFFVYVIDEAKLIAPQMKKTEANEIASDIAQRGRKRGILPIFSMQRPSEVDKSVITQCNVHLIGKIQFPTDLNYIKNFLMAHNISTEQIIGLHEEFYLLYRNTSFKIKFREINVKDLGKTIQPGDKIEFNFKNDQALETTKSRILNLLEAKLKQINEKKTKLQELKKELEETYREISNLKEQLKTERKIKKIIKKVDFSFENKIDKEKVKTFDSEKEGFQNSNNKSKIINKEIMVENNGKIIGNSPLIHLLNELTPLEREIYFKILKNNEILSLTKIYFLIKGRGKSTIKPAVYRLVRLNYLKKIKKKKRIYFRAIEI